MRISGVWPNVGEVCTGEALLKVKQRPAVRRGPRTGVGAIILFAVVGLGAGMVLGAETPWPMYQANPAHTGYVPLTLDTSAFALRWTHSIQSGIALNPVTAAEGKVFVSRGGSFDNSGLYVLDAANGSLLWSTSFGNVFSVNPPSYAYGNVYIQNGNGFGTYNSGLHAYQANTGTVLFGSPVSAQWEWYLAPTVYAGNVYVDGGTYGGMYSFNATNGTQNWFGYVAQFDGWTPAVDTNYCYVFTGSGDTVPIIGEFRIIDRFSGTTLYLIRDNAFQWNGYTMNAAVTLGTNNDAFAINEPGSVYPNYSANGRLLMFDLRADGTHAPHIGWVLSDHFTGQPTLANGVIYANDGGSLVALNEMTGQLLWTWTPPTGSLGDTMIASDNILVARTDSTTYAIDLASHQSVWSYPASGHLALGEGVLYVAAANGVLTAISAPSIVQATNHAPVCQIGGPYTAECQGPLTRVQLDGSASSDPDGHPLTFTWASDCPSASFDNPARPTPTLTLDSFGGQSCTVTLVVSDGQLTATNHTSITVVDTTPPTITCASNKVVECGSRWNFDLPSTSDTCCGTNVILTVVSTVTNASTSPFGLEDITRTWGATDCAGNSNSCSQTVTVVDTQPPDLSQVCPVPAALWPPDHKLIPVVIEGRVTDSCDAEPVCRIVSVTSSEPPLNNGGSWGPIYEITGPRTLLLRAERNDGRAARLYRIVVEAKDATGNTARRTVVVEVPGTANRLKPNPKRR